MRRARLHRLVLPALVGFVALAPASAAAAPPRCEDKVGDTLARTASVRVFQRVEGTDDERQTLRLYACRIRSRAFVPVDRFRNSLDGRVVIQEALVGGSRWLALTFAAETGTSESFGVFGYDLTTGRRTFTFSREGAREGAQVALTRSGGIGLLDGGAVRAFDAAGPRVLAPSGASALAAGEDTLYWTAEASPKSARLTGNARAD